MAWNERTQKRQMRHFDRFETDFMDEEWHRLHRPPTGCWYFRKYSLARKWKVLRSGRQIFVPLVVDGVRELTEHVELVLQIGDQFQRF